MESIRDMGIECTYSMEELELACYGLIQKNKLKEGGVKLILTGGASPNAYTFVKPCLMIFTLKIPVYPAEFYKTGLPLISLEHVRQFHKIKSTNYFVSLSNRKLLAEAGAEDFVYFQDQHVSESSRSNIFLIKDGVVKTPEKDILFGVTRKYTLMLASKEYKIKIGNLSLKDFLTADEVFLTSTTKKIMPVSRIDDQYYQYNENSICFKLLEALNQLHEKYINDRAY
jgi:branched-chain amino acid aminotransferase